MSRTNGRFEAKTGFTDAVRSISPAGITEAISVPIGALSVATDLISYHVPASQTALMFAFVAELMRTGSAPFLQEQFGTAAAVAGPSAVANTSSPEAIPAPYYPPFTGYAQLTPQTGYTPKGLKPLSLDIAYRIGVADMTTFNIKLIARQFVSGAVNPTDTVLFAQTNLSKVHSANIGVVNVPVTTPTFIVTPDTLLQVVINAVTPATCTLDIYGLQLKFGYNFA